MNDTTKLRTRFVVAVALALLCFSSGAAMAASNKLIVKDSEGTTDKFVVTDGGRVGIGNSAPDASLHIKGTTYPDTTIKVEGTGGGGFIAYTPYTPQSLPTTGARLGFQYFGAINSSVNPTTALHATGFFAGAESNWSTTSTPSYFAFETTPAGQTTRVERMRIASNGNVGIGTALPSHKLEIRDGGIRFNNGAAQPECSNTTAPQMRGTIWFVKGTTGVADRLQICAKDTANYAWRTIPLQ